MIFDNAAEYEDVLDIMESAGLCPSDVELKEIECTAETIMCNMVVRRGCRKCWDAALKEIAEVKE